MWGKLNVEEVLVDNRTTRPEANAVGVFKEMEWVLYTWEWPERHSVREEAGEVT